MPEVTWQGRDALGRVIDISGDTNSMEGPPGPSSITTVVSSASDPGALGAGSVWVRKDGYNLYSIYVRNAEDTAWQIPMVAAHATTGAGEIPRGYMQVTADTFVAYLQDAEETAGAQVTLDLTGGIAEGIVSLHGTRRIVQRVGNSRVALESTGFYIGASSTSPGILKGTADPTASSGVAAVEGSIYMRTTGGAGQLWLKAGAANTAWTQLATVV